MVEKKYKYLKLAWVLIFLFLVNTLIVYAPPGGKMHYERKGASVVYEHEGTTYRLIVRDTITKTVGKPVRVIELHIYEGGTLLISEALERKEFQWSMDHCQLVTELTVDGESHILYVSWETIPPTETYKVTHPDYGEIKGEMRRATVDLEWGPFAYNDESGVVWHTTASK
jgi:hypothetical protein